MTISQALQQASKMIEEVSTTSFLDAEMLLASALGVSRTELLMYPEKELEALQEKAFNGLVQQRKTGKPVAYITGHKEFYGREFMVDERALIPRPETELIIEAAKKILETVKEPMIVDVGTGSGAIACTLQLELPNANVAATDISEDALEVAHENAARLRANVTFSHGDLYQAFPDSLQGQIDLIVSNPPYLPPELAMDTKETTALQFEPIQALTPGINSFWLVKELIAGARDWLCPNGALLIEIGHDHGKQAVEAAQKAFPIHEVVIKKDLAGFDRLLMVHVPVE